MRRLINLLACVLLPVVGLSGQQGAAMMPSFAISAAEAAAVAAGWSNLATGDAESTLRTASSLQARYPRSPAVLHLVVEADLKFNTPAAALNTYERWRAGRPIEEPLVLRRIARAILHVEGTTGTHVPAKLKALEALSEDGEIIQWAGADAAETEAATSTRTMVLAAAGNETAIRSVAAALQRGEGSAGRLIDMLVASGSPAAIGPLMAQLSHPSDDARASAIEGLGILGATQAIPELRPLVTHPRLQIRQAAAGALYRLGDDTGLPVLQAMASHEAPAVQIVAATLMAARPDLGWESWVQRLAQADDPMVRVEAARLLGPVNPDLARAVLDAALADPNPAIREFAQQIRAETAVGDFSLLRAMLLDADPAVRVAAAERVLLFTR